MKRKRKRLDLSFIEIPPAPKKKKRRKIIPFPEELVNKMKIPVEDWELKDTMKMNKGIYHSLITFMCIFRIYRKYIIEDELIFDTISQFMKKFVKPEIFSYMSSRKITDVCKYPLYIRDLRFVLDSQETGEYDICKKIVLQYILDPLDSVDKKHEIINGNYEGQGRIHKLLETDGEIERIIFVVFSSKEKKLDTPKKIRKKIMTKSAWQYFEQVAPCDIRLEFLRVSDAIRFQRCVQDFKHTSNRFSHYTYSNSDHLVPGMTKVEKFEMQRNPGFIHKTDAKKYRRIRKNDPIAMIFGSDSGTLVKTKMNSESTGKTISIRRIV